MRAKVKQADAGGRTLTDAGRPIASELETDAARPRPVP